MTDGPRQDHDPFAGPRPKRSWSGLTLALWATGLSTCITAPASCSYVGHHRATTFCEETPIGSPVEEFRARAKTRMDLLLEDPSLSVEKRQDPRASGHLAAMASGFVFLRYFCSVDYVEGKITNKSVTSLD